MSRIALTSRDMAMKQVRRRYVPVASTVAAIMIVLLPVVLSAPLIPDFGYLFLIAWRLLRPEMWTARTALPLGFLSDLVSGHPVGLSMALWTMTFLILDFIESRAVFRDYWLDWLLASLLILFYTAGSWLAARLMGSQAAFGVLWPQIALSILFYPVVARIVVALDRWRLTR
ncbi:MAG: rod shape-determining protein MreD [Pseudomonadota bacterium]|nr:rod shape-determining protein MreD [Pseudomonadota bacterium]